MEVEHFKIDKNTLKVENNLTSLPHALYVKNYAVNVTVTSVCVSSSTVDLKFVKEREKRTF